jgi:branched-chain amino acid transport system permease protein
MARLQTEEKESYLRRICRWLTSTGGLTICLSVIAAVLATIDKGTFVIVNILVTGGMWALMAIGLALIFGVMNIANFAQGEYFMVGSLVAYYVFTSLNNYVGQNANALLTLLTPIIAIGAATLFGIFAGLVTEKAIFYQLRKRSRGEWLLNCFLITLGISIILVNGHMLIFGNTLKGIVGYWNVPPISIFGVNISVDRVAVFTIAILTMSAFVIFLKYSKTGQAIRAVSQDEAGARMVGISVNPLHTLTWCLSCGLATLAGGSLLFIFPSYPTVGVWPLYNSWFVIVVVGFGNVIGSMSGGFIIALLQVLTRVYVGEGWEYIIPVIMISVILIFKPGGIFGSVVKGVWER